MGRYRIRVHFRVVVARKRELHGCAGLGGNERVFNGEMETYRALYRFQRIEMMIEREWAVGHNSVQHQTVCCGARNRGTERPSDRRNLAVA